VNPTKGGNKELLLRLGGESNADGPKENWVGGKREGEKRTNRRGWEKRARTKHRRAGRDLGERVQGVSMQKDPKGKEDNRLVGRPSTRKKDGSDVLKKKERAQAELLPQSPLARGKGRWGVVGGGGRNKDNSQVVSVKALWFNTATNDMWKNP